jgi:hypothetical protein
MTSCFYRLRQALLGGQNPPPPLASSSFKIYKPLFQHNAQRSVHRCWILSQPIKPNKINSESDRQTPPFSFFHTLQRNLVHQTQRSDIDYIILGGSRQFAVEISCTLMARKTSDPRLQSYLEYEIRIPCRES